MSVMEEDLDQMLRSNIEFGEEHLVKVVYNILCSVAFLHEANVMHRDI